jgi:hypothetical protein
MLRRADQERFSEYGRALFAVATAQGKTESALSTEELGSD